MPKVTRREEIIASSIRVFSRKNYGITTTMELAREAGVAEGTLFRHFGSKKELFLECFRYINRFLIERYRGIYEETRDDPLEYLRRVAISYYRLVEEDSAIPKFLFLVLNNTFEPEIFDELKGFMELHVNATASIIERAIERGDIARDTDPASIAWAIVGGYFTILVMHELSVTSGEKGVAMIERYLHTLFG